MNCAHVFKSGKRKGKMCGRDTNGNSHCTKHTPAVVSTHPPFLETLDVLQLKYFALDTSPENKAVIVKKMSYLNTLSVSSTEYQKNFNWLRHALNFPYNNMVKTPVSIKTSKNKDISDYVTLVYKKLDSYIYGMPDVKEELLTFVAKRISNPDSTDHVLALQGSNGVGKCFARDTEMLMFDGSKKKVQDVAVGDLLMGDDSVPRRVLTLGGGYDDLYKITHVKTGDFYTVNGDHILCLKAAHGSKMRPAELVGSDDTLEMTVSDYLKSHHRDSLRGYTVGVDYPHVDTAIDPYLLGTWFRGGTALHSRRSPIDGKYIPKEHLVNSRECRLQLLRGVLEGISVGITVTTDQNATYEFVVADKGWMDEMKELCTSLGFDVATESVSQSDGTMNYRMTIKGTGDDVPTSPIEVEHVGKGDYYGFTVDGNERFVLGNYIVTHNTKLAHGLAQALDLPIKTINLGSVNDVSYFTGHGFTYVDSEPGRIVQILNETQCKNCIIYFDELDKIHKTDKGQSIYAFLTHLIDPSQNTKYQDVYLSGLDLDVSNVFFVFSYNDEDQIDPTVKDRLKIIRIKDPSHEDKINIAEKFIIPEICRNVNYHIDIDRSIIEHIVSQDNRSGLRGVRRVLEDVINKMNMVRLLDENVRDKMSFWDDCNDTMINKIIRGHRTEAARYEQMFS